MVIPSFVVLMVRLLAVKTPTKSKDGFHEVQKGHLGFLF
jgi:hypothetical protein